MTDADLVQWRAALREGTDTTIHSYPVNHLLHPTTALGAPADYLAPGTVATEIIDDLTTWARSVEPPRRRT